MKYELKRNADYNSIEISFDAKPTAEIIQGLKALKYRWHSAKKVWYGYTTENEVLAVLEGKQTQSKAIDTYAQEQEENRKLFAELLAAKKDSDIEWKMKHTAAIVKLDCNILYVFDRPSIETSFCFGYGYCGISTQEQYEDASDMAHYAATNENYFLKENLEKVTYDWKAENKNRPMYFSNTYYYGTEELGVTDHPQTKEWYNLEGKKTPTARDLEKLQEAQDHIKADFEKRLKTYLKRYGTSKLKTWSYLSD